METKLNKTGFVELGGTIYPTFTSEVNGIQITTLDYPSMLPKPYTNNKPSIEVLDKMAEIAKNAGFILTYSKDKKMVSGVTDSYGSLLDDNSIIHTKFKITGTSTGRLASQNPNIQNILKPTSNVYSPLRLSCVCRNAQSENHPRSHQAEWHPLNCTFDLCLQSTVC